ncbi:MAG TPA: hypothetical protein VIL49_04555 [Capillimicrobium sp.]
MTFLAYNPTVGEPYFRLLEVAGAQAVGDVQTYDMVEGEVQRATVGGVELQLERQRDTDNKVMRVIVPGQATGG